MNKYSNLNTFASKCGWVEVKAILLIAYGNQKDRSRLVSKIAERVMIIRVFKVITVSYCG
jgi:hypothetical protein